MNWTPRTCVIILLTTTVNSIDPAGHRAGRIAEVVMPEQLLNITGFTPELVKTVDIEATLKSRGGSPDLMRLQEIHVIMGSWAALICFASQLWHGRYAAMTFSESVYGDRMSTDPRGASSRQTPLILALLATLPRKL